MESPTIFKPRYVINFLTMLLVLQACQDYLDINPDPNNASIPEASKLLTGAQVNFVAALTESYEPGAATMVQHILSPGWNTTFLDNPLILGWDQLYSGALIDLHNLIQLQDQVGSPHYSGISKILMAYIYSLLVDLFGTVPFSEALLGDSNNIFNPNYQQGQDIYNTLFEIIESALTDLNQQAELSPAEDDLIYQGDITLWMKAGNSLKLKLYNQIRLVDPVLAKIEIDKLIEQNNLISTVHENLSFHFGSSISPENRHPLYVNNYSFNRPLMSDFLGRVVMGGQGDPRIPYYFYNQSEEFLASIGGSDNTLYGIYPVGGLYDDGSATTVKQTAASGAGIFSMITHAMVLFIQAEASLTLGTLGDTRMLLETAMLNSMEEVQNFSGIPMPPETVNAYIENRLLAYDSVPTNEEKLAIIMTEKYIAVFGNGFEAYNDVRRTGFPKFQSKFFPLRWKLPETEIRFNNNAPDAHDVMEPVFWDID